MPPSNAFHVQQDGTLQGGDATLNLMEIFPPHFFFCAEPSERLSLVGHEAPSLLDELGNVKPHGPLVSIARKTNSRNNKTKQNQHHKEKPEKGTVALSS